MSITVVMIAVAILFIVLSQASHVVDYGIWQERDLDLEASAADVDRAALLDAQQITLEQHNQDVSRLLTIFTDPVTKNQSSIKYGTDAKMQPLDENGRPQPIKGRDWYYVGYPLWKAGVAEGYNFWTYEQMTVKDFADSFNLMLQADINHIRALMLSALYYNGSGFTYADPLQAENVTVYGLANGDTNVYDKDSGAAIDDHYGAQASGIADATNPYPTIFTELTEHPQNGNRVVSFIPTGLETTTRALADFAPFDRNIIEVTPAASAASTDPLFSPSLNMPLSSTMKFIGYVSSNAIVVWNQLPANYIISVAVDADMKPLAAREYVQPRLRGLINQGEPMSRFPYQQNNYLRAIGFGGRNRVAAQVTRVGNGTYAVPSGYTFPGMK